MTLAEELARLLNKHSAENGSNTPDYILAAYLLTCLGAFNGAVRARQEWYRTEESKMRDLYATESTQPAPRCECSYGFPDNDKGPWHLIRCSQYVPMQPAPRCEVCNGTTLVLNIHGEPDDCTACNNGRAKRCERCGGTGSVHAHEYGMPASVSMDCPACGGTGAKP